MKMKKIMLAAMLVLACALAAGCARAPSADEIARADYGPYPENYQQIVKAYAGTLLRDPYSAHYQFGAPPQKGWFVRPPIWGGGTLYGFKGTVGINAKNGFGAYAGMKTYVYMIYRGNVTFFDDAQFVNDL